MTKFILLPIWIIILCFFFNPYSGKAQHEGLLLIHKEKISKRLIKKGQRLKIFHSTIGGLILTDGYFEGKTKGLIYFRPEGKFVTPESNYVSNEINLYPSIPINNIVYISPRRRAIQPFFQVVGIGVALFSGLAIIYSSKNCAGSLCSKPEERTGHLTGGLIGLGLSTTFIIINRKKRYKIQNGSWVIN